MLTLGISHDAGRWMAAAWDENHAADLHAFPSAAAVWEFVDDFLVCHPATPVVLPSGFGVPLTRARDLMDQDIAEMTLTPAAHAGGGVGGFLAEARRRPLRAFCIPAVKLLASVPCYRKLNRLDLGSAEVLCAATWALFASAEAGRPYAAIDFLLVHAATAGTALAVVRSGRIVDGVGPLQDAAAAPTLPPGLLALRSRRPRSGTESPAADRGSGALQEARRLLLDESLVKAVAALRGIHGDLEVAAAGKDRSRITHVLRGHAPLAPLAPPLDGYEAALGGALIAAGLTGGPTGPLVEHLGIRGARERVLDWLL